MGSRKRRHEVEAPQSVAILCHLASAVHDFSPERYKAIAAQEPASRYRSDRRRAGACSWVRAVGG